MNRGRPDRRPRSSRFPEALIRPRYSRRSGLLLLLILGATSPASGQEPDEAAEPAQGDTLVGRLPGELTGTLADSAAEESFPQLTEELRPPTDGWSWAAYEWDREDILQSNALTLLDLLSTVVPGVTALRATWFGGPHQAVEGVLGPGFVSISVDGRELTTLDAGQVDFTRIALAGVESVRVRRRSDGWVAEITTLRRDRRPAYSRITGGTGDPDLNRLQLVFSNGIGDHFNLSTAVGLLDSGGDNPQNDFDFWGRVEWLPGGGDAGVELHWASESVEREVYEPDEFSRKELFLRGRGNLGDHLQAEAFVGTSGRDREDEELASSTHAGFRLTGVTDRGWAGVRVRMWDDPLYATVDADVEAGYRVLPWLSVSAGGRLGSWEEFTSSEVRAGVAAQLPLGLAARAEGASGVRGVSYPTLQRSDSVSFDAVAGDLSLVVGPYALTGRGEYQKLSRQLPFGAEFDRDQTARGAAEVGIAEGALSGPLIPLGLVLNGVEPIALRGFWRYASVLSGEPPWYLPANLARAELYWTDSFFEGDQLEVFAGFALNYRDAMVSAPAPSTGGEVGVEVPGYSFLDWNLMIRILEVRVYWRFENLRIEEGQDFPGLTFPVRRSVFGVKWEFLN